MKEETKALLDKASRAIQLAEKTSKEANLDFAAQSFSELELKKGS